MSLYSVYRQEIPWWLFLLTPYVPIIVRVVAVVVVQAFS